MGIDAINYAKINRISVTKFGGKKILIMYKNIDIFKLELALECFIFTLKGWTTRDQQKCC